MILPRFLAIFCCLFLFGCASQPSQQDKELKPPNTGYILRFSETNPGESERYVRMIVTDKFLRIDEGEQSKDFVLFNRENKTIADIVQNEVSIHQINSVDQHVSPAFPLQWLIESQVSQALMRTQDNTQASAMHYRFYLNDEPCYNLVAIKSHLTETVDALREYNHARANKLKKTYRASEGQQCREAIKIFAPDVRLQYGFPLREWSKDGYQRFLMDYQKDIIFPERLFRLPNIS